MAGRFDGYIKDCEFNKTMYVIARVHRIESLDAETWEFFDGENWSDDLDVKHHLYEDEEMANNDNTEGGTVCKIATRVGDPYYVLG